MAGPNAGDWPAGSGGELEATHIYVSAPKIYYRVRALDSLTSAVSDPSPVFTPFLPSLDATVRLTAIVEPGSASEQQATVTLQWPDGTLNDFFLAVDAVTYDVFRKAPSARAWIQLNTSPLPGDVEHPGEPLVINEFVDTITEGTIWEYKVSRKVTGDLPNLPNVTLGAGNGYASVGCEAKAVMSGRGTVLLVVDETLATDLEDSRGSGIVTSQTDATMDVFTGLGVKSAADIFGISGSETALFGSETVTAGDVVIKYTYGGDADLNGELNGDDYFWIDSHVAQSGSVFGYHYGDFNYDGEINGDDYFILDSNILRQGGPL